MLGLAIQYRDVKELLAPKHIIEEPTCRSGQPTVGGKPTNVIKSRGSNSDSFEYTFLLKAATMGGSELDRVLISLLKLSENSVLEEDVNNPGRFCLINKTNFSKLIQNSSSQKLIRSFKLERKKRVFSYVSFAKRHGLNFCDLIGSTCPSIFTDYRRVLHTVKLSWALYLTLKMKGVSLAFRKKIDFRGKWTKPSSKNILTLLFVFIYAQLRRQKIVDEKDIIKCFKTSLCYAVSDILNQSEFPEGKRIDLIPRSIVRNIQRKTYLEQVNIYFSFLQSKALCQTVPLSFIQETLEKHRAQLSSPHKGIDQETLDLLVKEGEIFGAKVKKYFRPNEGFYPTNKATFQFPRNVGGMKGDLVFNNRLSNIKDSDPLDRPEPLVVGLFGQPGQGKSLFLNNLKILFQEMFPGKKKGDLFYARTSNCRHWDGYHHQPIVILDDIGQSRRRY